MSPLPTTVEQPPQKKSEKHKERWTTIVDHLVAVVGAATLGSGQCVRRETLWRERDLATTYSSVGRLLLFVALLVRGSLGFVGSLLLLRELLPLLSEKLADLACDMLVRRLRSGRLIRNATYQT